jgi:hypothetical protein
MMVVSQRITQVMGRLGPVAHFFTASTYARRAGEPRQPARTGTAALQKATQGG